MSVFRDTTALTQLRTYLTTGHSDLPDTGLDFAGMPPRAGVNPWLWGSGQAQLGHLDPNAYVLADEASLQDSPAQSLGALVTDAASADPRAMDRPQRTYVRHSINVTMKGGTTSGVIYPLAVCELARHFRFRNIGGASAGAIAAAMTAAAEYGRMTGARAEQPPLPRSTDDPNSAGRLRPGFAGVADIVAWLTQLDDEEPGKEEFRLAQLFKPSAAGRGIFRVAAAVMRKAAATVPLLILLGIGQVARGVILGVLAAAPFLLALTLGNPAGMGPGVGGYLVAVLAAALLLLLTATALLAALGFFLLRPPRPRPVKPGFAEPVANPPAAPRTPRFRYLVVAAVCAVVLVVLMVAWYGVGLIPAVIAHVLAEVIVVLGVFVRSVTVILKHAKGHGYGLVGGANPTVEENTQPARASADSWADRLALPPTTVTPGLSDWLTTALDDLSGLQQGTILRFGHLWCGAAFTQGAKPATSYGAPAGDGWQPPTLHELSLHPAMRRINLELISTELVRRQPYRFPLPDRDTPTMAAGAEVGASHRVPDWVERGRLCFDPADLRRVLPEVVVQAMIGDEDPVGFVTPDPETDGQVALYPLPQPWDLPVVFAVRASLSFPTLFEAIRLYEVVLPAASADSVERDAGLVVRTEFGQPFDAGDGLLRYPSLPAETLVANELWLTDGGVTSNFPIHLFDTVLPLWPTVGLDLGDYPLGAGHQDVKLSLDDAPGPTILRPLRSSLTSFLGAGLGTSLSWRDSSQLVMPAVRGRIAVVRQGDGEGGTNLYMEREKIASLALRGMVAGMRLRRRFAEDAYWQRHQWLRTRVAADNLGDVATGVAAALGDPTYACLLADRDAARAKLAGVHARLAEHPDPTPPLKAYCPEDPAWQDRYWAQLAPLLPAPPVETDALSVDLPAPVAELRQVPPG